MYITTYNRRKLLERAINSVLNQTHSPIELIVADDGSTDGSQEYLTEMHEQGILTAILNTTGKSKGACYGRNRAISMAKGEFISGLDDDDYFEPWRIETFIKKWQEYTVNINVFSALFDSVVEHRKSGPVACYDTGVATYQKLRKGNVVGNQVFTKTSYLKAVGGFDEQMPALQDWDTWLRLSNQYGDILNVNTRSYIQIQNHEGERITGKPADKIRFAFNRLMNKLQPLTRSEESHLLATMYSGYPQIDIRISELFKIFMGGHFRKVAQVVKRTLLK
ncbi:glycosyl transferase family protein [Alteromonas mediterranea DE1]|nr:glycosyl transferase family protein [Alteromonas mediterranea DE1]AGP97178.1 glycosyl transferase [Alteromonas mediterranea UM7]